MCKWKKSRGVPQNNGNSVVLAVRQEPCGMLRNSTRGRACMCGAGVGIAAAPPLLVVLNPQLLYVCPQGRLAPVWSGDQQRLLRGRQHDLQEAWNNRPEHPIAATPSPQPGQALMRSRGVWTCHLDEASTCNSAALSAHTLLLRQSQGNPRRLHCHPHFINA